VISTYPQTKMLFAVDNSQISNVDDNYVDKYGQITQLSTICSLNKNKVKSFSRMNLTKKMSSYAHIHTAY
jgi:hypothetical protein